MSESLNALLRDALIRGRKFSGLENGQVQTAVTFFLDGISGRGKIPLRAVT